MGLVVLFVEGDGDGHSGVFSEACSSPLTLGENMC